MIKQISIETKHKTLVARWIFGAQSGIRQVDGMLKPDVAELLGVSQPNLAQISKRHGLHFVTLSYETKTTLRNDNVIKAKGRAPSFIPQDVIDALVKIVNTDEAWAAYNQLLAAVRDPVANVQMQKDAGRSDEQIKLYFERGLSEVMSEVVKVQASNKKILAEVKDIKRSFLSEIKQKVKLALSPDKVRATPEIHQQMEVIMGNISLVDKQYHGMMRGIGTSLAKHGMITNRQLSAIKRGYDVVMDRAAERGY